MLRQFPEQVPAWTLYGKPERLSKLLCVSGGKSEEEFVAEFVTARIIQFRIAPNKEHRWYLYGDAYWGAGSSPLPRQPCTLVVDLSSISQAVVKNRINQPLPGTSHTLVMMDYGPLNKGMLKQITRHIEELKEIELDPSITAACACAVTVGIVNLKHPALPIVGSGVVVSQDGFVATNRHVLESIVDSKLEESNVGVLVWHRTGHRTRSHIIKPVGHWIVEDIKNKNAISIPKNASDVGLVYLGIDQIPHASLLESWSAAVPGANILACGYPLGDAYLKDESGLRQRMPFVHGGILSARREDEGGNLEQWVCDLPVLPGSSGSPVFLTDRAELIGLVSHSLTYNAEVRELLPEVPLLTKSKLQWTDVHGPTSWVVPVTVIMKCMDNMRSAHPSLKPRENWEACKKKMDEL